MARTPALIALAVALAATPVALGHGKAPDRPADRGPGVEKPQGEKPQGEKPHGKKPAQHLAQACVVATADGGVQVKILSANAHLRKALAGEKTFTVKVSEDTRVQLVGKARVLPAGGAEKKGPKAGTLADLGVGDWITVHIRAPRGTAAADLPAAKRVIDHGAHRRCALPAPPPPDDTSSEEQPPAPTDPTL